MENDTQPEKASKAYAIKGAILVMCVVGAGTVIGSDGRMGRSSAIVFAPVQTLRRKPQDPVVETLSRGHMESPIRVLWIWERASVFPARG